MLLSLLIFFPLLTAGHVIDKRGEPDHSSAPSLTIQMPGAIPKGTDSYFCTAFNLAELAPDHETIYVTKFEPVAAASERAHHMLLYACEEPNRNEKIWDCRHHQTCAGGKSGILFAWAKNAPAKELPAGVGFQLGHRDPKNLVLQVHYVNELEDKDYTGLRLYYQTEPTKHTAGIFLMWKGYLPIPANTPVVHGEMNCKVRTSSVLHPFAFRTHAHALGTVITGYKYSPKTMQFKEIARGNPQWPQAFYPMKEIETVEDGDYFVARCTYNSTGVNHMTNIGSGATDEMCNLYMMYYLEEGKTTYQDCGDVQDQALAQLIPADSDQPLPPNPLLEQHASHSKKNHAKGDLEKVGGSDDDAAASEKRRKGDLDNPIEDVDPSVKTQLSLEIAMPGAEPKEDDEYFCSAFEVKKLTGGKRVYLTEFDARATALKAHHLILQKCDRPIKKEGFIWNCRHHSVCQGETKILYAWAKDAPPTQMPPDVGFKLDPSDGYLVLQVHYAHGLQGKDYTGLHMTYQENRPTNIAGIFLLLRSYLHIPPHVPKVHGDMNCRVESPLTLFAFRTHAHSLGAVITGYAVKDGAWREVARGDPQRPQTFYPMKKFEEVGKGDYLVGRCTFNSTGSNKVVNIGSTAGDEMCNLYLMYYTQSESDDMRLCLDEQESSLSSSYPADSDLTFAELHMEQPVSYTNGGEGDQSTLIPQKDKKQDDGRESKQLQNSDLYPVPNWPTKETAAKLGQISGVAIDVYGNPVIFHRGDRTWTSNSFKMNNEYNEDRSKPIPTDTVLTLNASGHIINSWGSGLFFMPHMITIDSKNNIWMTDVALHQIFKFAQYGGTDKKPLISMGEPFVPGSDDTHYCKPTSVAVASDGETFFVADGYCNSRIIKYSVKVDPSTGLHQVTKLLQWGEANGAGLTASVSPYSFNVPHSLALAEDKKAICVADRENSRVQCFNSEDGKFLRTLQPKGMGRVYSVAYAPVDGGTIYAVNGPSPFTLITGVRAEGLVIGLDSGNLKATFNGDGDGFQNPHDVAVSKDGSTLYEVELSPFRVWKLTNGKSTSSGPIPPFPAVPSDKSGSGLSGVDLTKLTAMVPSSTWGLSIAIGSVLLTCCVSACLACRRCRKRGKGTMLRTNGTTSTKKSKRKDGKLDLGDFLGRSKDGFKPLKTEDDDHDAGAISSDSDDLEEFSVPALRA